MQQPAPAVVYVGAMWKSLMSSNKGHLSVVVDIFEDAEDTSHDVRWSVRFSDETKPHACGEAPTRETAFAIVGTVFTDMADARRLRRKR